MLLAALVSITLVLYYGLYFELLIVSKPLNLNF